MFPPEKSNCEDIIIDEDVDASYSRMLNDISESCKKKGLDYSAEFIKFLVSLLHVSNCVESNSSKDNNVLGAVEGKLLGDITPSMITLKLQFYFTKNYRNRDHLIRKYRNKISQKTYPLIKEICDINKLDNAREIECLYQKMLVVITILSGQGDPTVPAVLREVAIALQSVIQPSELSRYICLFKSEKERQLVELALIVAGIRLFNRDCQRGGEGIEDLPGILQNSVNRTRSLIIKILESLMDAIYNLTAITETAVQCIDDKVKLKINDKDVTWTVQMLVASRQQEIYVRKLLADLDCCEESMKHSINQLQCGLNQIHETVKFRTAVPTTQVYPQFKDIARTWINLQDEVIILSSINEMLLQLQNLFPKTFDSRNEKIFKRMQDDIVVFTDAERLEVTMGKYIGECGGLPITYTNADPNYCKINLQYLGFCAWNFVIGNGALIPGNPNIGIVEFEGKFFSFSSISAANRFGNEPHKFVHDGMEICLKYPEYIHLFQLYNEIEVVNSQQKLDCQLSGECKPVKTLQNQEVQTELHVFPTLIDKDYTHNLWEYRKRALKLANIFQCRTKSTQTHKSQFRIGACIQTAPSIEKETQTRKDSGTSTCFDLYSGGYIVEISGDRKKAMI